MPKLKVFYTILESTNPEREIEEMYVCGICFVTCFCVIMSIIYWTYCEILRSFKICFRCRTE
uniref:Uncharacterized protein n=1 Tax=Arundo donax TaxID=35708 RepID=A0A0A9C130_ARUDO